MSEPFLGQISLISFNFPPKGWAFCNGQLLPINQNQALFSILGTTYGGNGQTTFALPNLQGSVPLHFGNGFVLGQVQGRGQSHPDPGRDGDSHPPGGRLVRHGEFALAVGPPLGDPGREPLRDGADRFHGPVDDDHGRRGPGRTTTSSRTWLSISSSRSRAFSRRGTEREEPGHGPLRRRDPDLRRQLRPNRVGVLQRSDHVDLAKHCASSRSWGRPTAGTASPPLRCRTSRGASRSGRARAPG